MAGTMVVVGTGIGVTGTGFLLVATGAIRAASILSTGNLIVTLLGTDTGTAFEYGNLRDIRVG